MGAYRPVSLQAPAGEQPGTGLNNRWATKANALLAALVFAFGSSAWSIGSRALWQQTASMLFLSLALLALQRVDRRPRQAILFGCWLGFALVMRPTNAVAVALFLTWLCIRKRRAVVPAAAGFGAVLVPFLLFSRCGQFLPPNYQPNRLEEAPNFDFWESLAVNLVSPSRGLLVFDGVAVLAVFGIIMSLRRKTFTEVDGLLALSCLGQLIVIASYGSTGGSTFGPRLMIDCLPFLVLLAVPTFSLLTTPFREKSAAARVAVIGLSALLLWGLFVNATGGLMRAGFCWSATPVQIDQQPDRVWDWSDPQFLRPYADLLHGRSVGDVTVAGSCSAT